MPEAGGSSSSWRFRVIASAALVLLAFSVVGLAASWKADIGTTHAVVGPAPTDLNLSAGSHWIYEDPGGTVAWPLPSTDIRIFGPTGPVAVTQKSSQVSAADFGELFLGVGSFAPIASFTAEQSGTFTVHIDQPPGNTMFVATTGDLAIQRVILWIVLVVLSLTAILVWAIIYSVRRRRKGQQRALFPSP
jgi:hypothetical protein